MQVSSVASEGQYYMEYIYIFLQNKKIFILFKRLLMFLGEPRVPKLLNGVILIISASFIVLWTKCKKNYVKYLTQDSSK